MNLTLKQLRAFVAVAETGSFTTAAQRLHVTPSALSLMTKELESTIGARLFERTTRKMRLAPAGRDFLPAARKLVEDLDRAVDGIREYQRGARGVLRIAGSPMYAATLLAHLTRAFRALHPNVNVTLIDTATRHVGAAVAGGDADLGIAPERSVPHEVVQSQLFRDPLRVVCRADHPLAALTEATWSQVLRHPFVALSADYTAGLRADLAVHSESLTLEPAVTVNFITTAMALVGAGEGVTVQPSAVEPLATAYGLVIRRVTDPVIARRICLLRPREREIAPAAETFRAFVENRFAVAEH